jgi:alpha-tubulin suppressor-like RCC1 family protein
MARNYPGGFVTKSPVATTGATDSGFGPEGGTASGMWTLDQAMGLKQSGLWPAKSKNKILYAMGTSGGVIGDNESINRSSPVQIGSDTSWSKITAGGNFSAAIKTNGTLWMWGQGGVGQLGQNNRVLISSPTQVGALTTWSDVSGGGTAVMAVKTDGSLWAWGSNLYGQLGLNDVVYRSSPVQIGSLYTWSKVAAGGQTQSSIKTDGTLWLWGNGSYGQLGDGAAIRRSSPVQVGALTTWSLVSGGKYHNIALQSTGSLWSFGYNGRGQLGRSPQGTNVSSPAQIGALTTWSKIAAGGMTCSAIKTDGTLWSWGRNEVGGLGTNTQGGGGFDKDSPVQVGSDTDWLTIDHGDATNGAVLAIRTSGTLWGWGSNGEGELGINTNTNRSSPVQIGTGTNWAKAVTSSGSLIIEAS